MILKLFRITTTIFEILSAIISIVLLFLTVNDFQKDSIITVVTLIAIFIISLILLYATIKGYKKPDCMLFDLAFDKAKTINKAALIIDSIFFLISITLLILGFINVFVMNNKVGGFAFLGCGEFIFFNTASYFIYLIDELKFNSL